MKAEVIILLVLGLAAAGMVRAAENASPQEAVLPATGAATNSPPANRVIPQLGPNTNLGPEVPLMEQPKPAPAPARQPEPSPFWGRHPVWVVLAVVAVLVVRSLIKRLYSKGDST